MKLELTEREHHHLQNILSRVKEENEEELKIATEHKWNARVTDELKAAESIFLKIS